MEFLIFDFEGHSNEGQRDNWKCDHCGKTFTQSGHLKYHIRVVHEGQRDHKCDICGKSFTTPGKLKQHIKTVHEGQKDYKCDFCGKTFSTLSNLKTHMRAVHEGKRDYICFYCNKAYGEARNLKQHLQKEHNHNLEEIDIKPDISTLQSNPNEEIINPVNEHFKIKSEVKDDDVDLNGKHDHFDHFLLG